MQIFGFAEAFHIEADPKILEFGCALTKGFFASNMTTSQILTYYKA